MSQLRDEVREEIAALRQDIDRRLGVLLQKLNGAPKPAAQPATAKQLSAETVAGLMAAARD